MHLPGLSAGSPPRLWRLWPQLAEFTMAVLVARACCGLLVSALSSRLCLAMSTRMLSCDAGGCLMPCPLDVCMAED